MDTSTLRLRWNSTRISEQRLNYYVNWNDTRILTRFGTLSFRLLIKGACSGMIGTCCRRAAEHPVEAGPMKIMPAQRTRLQATTVEIRAGLPLPVVVFRSG